MKFNGLKFIRNSAFVIAICCFTIACENKSANNSTKTSDDEKKAAENPTTPATTTGKKVGTVKVGVLPAATSEKMQKDEKGYYNYTEVSPEYHGGQGALDTYINGNIEYPQQAIDNSVEGTVHVQFAIDEKGNISNVETIGNKLGYGLEEEAVRVVSQMPKWEPGQVKGKFVKTKRTLPITYKLES